MSRMWFAWISEKSNGFAISATRAAPRSFDAADRLHDRVDHVERLHEALDDVEPVLRLLQPELAAPGHDDDLVVEPVLQRFRQVDGAGHVVDERDHVDRNVLCAAVCLNRLFSTICGLVSGRSSITSRVLPWPDSLRISRTPSILPAITSSASLPEIASTLVWNGTSVTTIAWPRRGSPRSR